MFRVNQQILKLRILLCLIKMLFLKWARVGNNCLLKKKLRMNSKLRMIKKDMKEKNKLSTKKNNDFNYFID